MTASHPDTPAMSAAPRGKQRGKDRASGRAGRNLVAAIGVGVGLGAVVLSSLLIERHWFIPVVALAAAVGTWELAGALRRGADIRVPLPVLLVGGQAMVWLAWPFGPAATAVAFAATALGVLLWRMPGGAEHYVRDVTAGVFTAAYVPLLCAFAALMVVAPDGAARVLVFMICVVASDVGGYTAGVLRASTRWRPRSAPRSPGRASRAPWSPAWWRARSASSSCCTGRGGRVCSPARCSSSPPRSGTSSSRS